MQGRVKWFDPGKGFGFIMSEGTEYFVHFTEINPDVDNFKTLKEGDKVSFEGEKSAKGPIARQVSVDTPDHPQYIKE